MSKAKKEFPGSRQSKRNARSRVSNPRSRPLGHGHHIREFVIYLDDVDYLAKKFRGKYKLDLRAIKGGKKTPCKSNRCANFKNLEEHLLDWEEELNEKSKDQPIIRVENLVDDCFPPKDFEFVLESVSSDKIQKMFDKSYLVGCDCRRCSPKVGRQAIYLSISIYTLLYNNQHWLLHTCLVSQLKFARLLLA